MALIIVELFMLILTSWTHNAPTRPASLSMAIQDISQYLVPASTLLAPVINNLLKFLRDPAATADSWRRFFGRQGDDSSDGKG